MLARVRSERGVELVEFAFTCLILLTVLFAIIEFGLIAFSYDTISDAAREACRWGVVAKRSEEQLARVEAHALDVTHEAGLSDAAVSTDAIKLGTDRLQVTVTYDMPMIPLLSNRATIRLTARSTKRIELD